MKKTKTNIEKIKVTTIKRKLYSLICLKCKQVISGNSENSCLYNLEQHKAKCKDEETDKKHG